MDKKKVHSLKPDDFGDKGWFNAQVILVCCVGDLFKAGYELIEE